MGIVYQSVDHANHINVQQASFPCNELFYVQSTENIRFRDKWNFKLFRVLCVQKKMMNFFKTEQEYLERDCIK